MRMHCSLFQGRMTVKIQIVIRREVEERFSVDLGFGLGNAVVALEEGIENACVLSNASLHLDLLVSRELLKLRHFRIGAPLHFIKRTTALCLYRSTSRSLEAEEKCRTI